LKQLHFRASDDWKLCAGIEAVTAYCDDWDAKREKLAYEIDGVVVKVNSIPFKMNWVIRRRLRGGPLRTNIRRGRKRR